MKKLIAGVALVILGSLRPAPTSARAAMVCELTGVSVESCCCVEAAGGGMTCTLTGETVSSCCCR